VDAQAEYERVAAKYAPYRLRDIVITVAVLLTIVAIAVALGHRVPALAVGALLGIPANQYRQYRLRENARKFAEAQRRAEAT
jgi:hypothetical protein